jgi:DNA-binding NarL/FixJ family response regulator
MSETVLLVEDETDARESLSRAIERSGRKCVSAESVDEALARLKAAPFVDVVVTDVVLGDDESGGIRLMPELKSIGVRAPVVVITAFADVVRVKDALNNGASYLLEKPFRAQQLLDIIQRVVSDPGDVAHYVDRALAHAGLTDKEAAVARHVLKGLTSSEIGRLESNSDKTIRQHITRIYQKCGVATRAEFFHFVFPA